MPPSISDSESEEAYQSEPENCQYLSISKFASIRALTKYIPIRQSWGNITGLMMKRAPVISTMKSMLLSKKVSQWTRTVKDGNESRIKVLLFLSPVYS